MTTIPFLKMHGLGNDFIIVDERHTQFKATPEVIKHLSDRHLGIGCDQFIVIGPSDQADGFMYIFNADGGEVKSCGNATRCVADILLKEKNRAAVTIETKAGLLKAQSRDKGLITVDMGKPGLSWNDIPLSHDMSTLELPLPLNQFTQNPTDQINPVAVSMGNPHAVFFVKDVMAIDLQTIGPHIENHPLFPEKTNVEFAEIKSPHEIRMRVWERGVGITQACGTGACATLVAAIRRNLCQDYAMLVLDGGTLEISWDQKNSVMMSGPIAYAFQGTFEV